MVKTLSIEVRDKQGKVISRSRQKPRSFVRAYNHIINVQFAQSSTPAIQTKDITGTLKNLTAVWTNLMCDGAVGETDLGIIVGTGTTAVTIEDYKLETPIAQGVGAGQMEYQAETFTQPQVAGNECSFTTQRIIVNNSGDIITVREAGIYVFGRSDTDGYYCGARDVLASAQPVPDGGSITITYTLKDVA